MTGVRAFEDKRWSQRDQTVVWRHQAAVELVRMEPVLDVGGGDGLFLKLLRERGLERLELVDLSPVAVGKAAAAGFDAQCLDITEQLPFPDNSFGTVCALDVLEHLYDPVSVLREMGRVGRNVVLAVPNFHYWKGRMHMVAGRIPFQSKPQRGHVHWFNYPVLKDVVADAGLAFDRIIFDGFRRFDPIGSWLARGYPNLFAAGFAARLTK